MRQKVLVPLVLMVCGLAWLAAGDHGPFTVGADRSVPLPIQDKVALPEPGTIVSTGVGAAATS